jgi:hypothetical protein
MTFMFSFNCLSNGLAIEVFCLISLKFGKLPRLNFIRLRLQTFFLFELRSIEGHLNIVLEVLRENKLFTKLKKCKF